MKIRLVNFHQLIQVELEFESKGVVHNMGTFHLQIPPAIRNLPIGKSVNISDHFMTHELGLPLGENPVQWFDSGAKQAEAMTDRTAGASASNDHFVKFMDVIAKFYYYDRKKTMGE